MSIPFLAWNWFLGTEQALNLIILGIVAVIMVFKTFSRIYRENVRQTLSKPCMRTYSTQTNLEITEVDGVRRIVMADIKTRNSLSKNMVSALKEAIKKDNTALRSIVISAKGPVFSAGHNLKELHSDMSSKTVFQECADLMLSLVNCPVPIIAAVDGLAAAAGCQLVAQCDITVCSKRSTFSTPGATFGIFCSTPGVPLVRSVGRKTAAYMLFSGFPLTAEEAYNAGLVSRITENDKLEDEVKRITDAIKEKSPAVISLGKKFFYQQLEMDLKSAYEQGGEVMVKNLSLEDGAEGVKSFCEKRKPKWKSVK